MLKVFLCVKNDVEKSSFCVLVWVDCAIVEAKMGLTFPGRKVQF